MTTAPLALLEERLARRFEDGSRRAVLVVGAGLHHHLCAHADPSPDVGSDDRWKTFCAWNGLLASVAADLRAKEVVHADPTATWESLVTRVAGRDDTAVSAVETRALRGLARRLRALPASDALLARFGAAVHAAGWRDVVSLNFDPSLDHALGGRRARPQILGLPRHLRPALHTAAVREGRAVRAWYPHGHVSDPETILLGQRAYGMGIEALEGARRRLKSAESLWRRRARASGPWTPAEHGAWEAARRDKNPFGASHERDDGHPRPLTWLDHFLLSDLVFLGCRLDRSEVDLWWALHQRARNHARIPPSERPRTLVLSLERELALPDRDHLRSGVADVLPVGLSEWDDGWEAVIGRWW